MNKQKLFMSFRWPTFVLLSLLMCIAACSTFSARPVDKPKISASEYGRVQDALYLSNTQKFVYMRYDGRMLEQNVEGLLLSKNLSDLKPLSSWDNAFASAGDVLILPIDISASIPGGVGSVSMFRDGDHVLSVDIESDGHTDVVVGFLGDNSIAWSLANSRLEDLLPCLREQMAARELGGVDACFPADPSDDESEGGGSVGPELDNVRDLWGEPDCSGSSSGSPVSEGEGDENEGQPADTDEAESESRSERAWRSTETTMRTRARYHRARAASLRKGGTRFAARAQAHEDAAVRADAAADAAEAQIPRAPDSVEYAEGEALYRSERAASDRATRSTGTRASGFLDLNVGGGWNFRSDSPPRSSRSDPAREPEPGEQPRAEDPRCRANDRNDLFQCGTDLKACLSTANDPVKDLTDGNCWEEEGPAGGKVIRCAPNTDTERSSCNDPASNDRCEDDFGIPTTDNGPRAGHILSTLPLGDVILGLCQGGGCPDPAPLIDAPPLP